MDENAQKQITDDLAGELLELDKAPLKYAAKEVADLLGTMNLRKILVTGGAGSGKTTFSDELANLAELRHFDMDKYVKGGYTKDASVYTQRLVDAVYKMWLVLPIAGWVVEHVEMGRPEFVQSFQPDAVILLPSGKEHLRNVAAARAIAAREPSPVEREDRAVQTSEQAEKRFDTLPWHEVKAPGKWRMKVRPS